jgi:hypothetical protein
MTCISSLLYGSTGTPKVMKEIEELGVGSSFDKASLWMTFLRQQWTCRALSADAGMIERCICSYWDRAG